MSSESGRRISSRAPQYAALSAALRCLQGAGRPRASLNEKSGQVHMGGSSDTRYSSSSPASHRE